MKDAILFLLSMIIGLIIALCATQAELNRTRNQLNCITEQFNNAFVPICIDGIPCKRPKLMKRKP